MKGAAINAIRLLLGATCAHACISYRFIGDIKSMGRLTLDSVGRSIGHAAGRWRCDNVLRTCMSENYEESVVYACASWMCHLEIGMEHNIPICPS